jgi:hypothetical protein
LPKFIETTDDGLMLVNGAQKKIAKQTRVARSESQCPPKDKGLVTTDRMCRVEAVFREFADVYKCAVSVRQKNGGTVAQMATPSSMVDTDRECFGLCILRGLKSELPRCKWHQP